MANRYRGLNTLQQRNKETASRCAERLLAIRKRLEPIRKRRREGTLLLATWNIRDFDSNKFKFGPRLPETFYYIAEVISSFDLVALQEVSRDLSALEKVMQILGPSWDYIATDTTEGPGGNGERMAFLYNRERVQFRKIAGEIVLPNGQLIVSRKKIAEASMANQPTVEPETIEQIKDEYVEVEQQFARTPFLVAFQSGWFRFSLCTVHIYFGNTGGEELKRRISEIEALVKFFADRQDKASRQEKDRDGNVENYILLGDFNVVSPEHKTMAALKSQGFTIPASIDGKKVDPERSHFYDQIATRVKDSRFKVRSGGIFNVFQDVFQDNDEDRDIYVPLMPAKDPERTETDPRALYLKWRTWQMSDHNPLWIEIDTDYTDDFLSQIVNKNHD